MLFAEFAAESWVLIIVAVCGASGVGGVVLQVVQMVLAYKRDALKDARDHEAARKVAEVAVDAKVARSASQTAAEVAANVATAHGEILQEVKQGVQNVEMNTNGRLEAKERENAMLRARLEAMLEAQVPPVVAEALPKLTEDVGHLVAVIDEADKSGVFKAPQKVDPANPPKRRHDDQK